MNTGSAISRGLERGTYLAAHPSVPTFTSELGKICTKPVVTASAQMTVEQAARAMRSRNVGALVVVNAGRPVGMLTDRDVAVEVVAKGMDPDAVRVGDVMHKKPVTIREDLGIFDAAKVFARTGVRRLPVVTKAGVLVGVIAVDDLIMLLGNELGHVAGALSAGLRRAS
jgi:CBS domain-containing protein